MSALSPNASTVSTSALPPAASPDQQLFNLLKQYGHCDLLLDRQLDDPMADALATLADQQLAFSVNPKPAAVALDKCVMLARLDLQQLERVEQSLAISLEQNTRPDLAKRSIGGWLFSTDTPPDSLARRLERAVLVGVKKPNESLLRVWDPRVIGHLGRILTPQQLAVMLGPIDCWAWIDRSGQLQQLHKPALSQEPTARTMLPLHLTVQQDQAIDRIEHINTTLKVLHQLGYSVPTSQDAQLDHTIQSALNKGHTAPGDMVTYALHALVYNRNFDDIPEVAQAIAQARQDNLGLSAALAAFNDDYWQPHKDAYALQPI
jgi:hypothetical protein